jgi:hypothetical protein
MNAVIAKSVLMRVSSERRHHSCSLPLQSAGVLFLELFPALLAVVAVVVGVILYAKNHAARNAPDEQPPAPKRHVPPGTREERGRGRPSMR